MAKAVMECPEGNEKRSGGIAVAQQWGSSAQGRGRPTARFKITNKAMPMHAAMDAARNAERLERLGAASNAIPQNAQNQPSPPRVDVTIHQRTQCGAFHRFR